MKFKMTRYSHYLKGHGNQADQFFFFLKKKDLGRAIYLPLQKNLLIKKENPSAPLLILSHFI